MNLPRYAQCRWHCPKFTLTIVLATLWSGPSTVAQPKGGFVLHIGATSTLTGKADDPKEKTGQELLHRFIKEETGMENEVAGQENWNDLAAKMVKGQTHLGVFQGYEFAWAQEKYAGLKPLALGVNVYRYPVACVLVKRDNRAADFAGLKGQSLAEPVMSQGYLRLFIERQSEVKDKDPAAFFGKIVAADNVEDALDDVVDGKVQAIVIDQSALDAFKRRKPGRAKQLKEIARSQPFPPTVVAYHGAVLDPATLQRFRNCLLNASNKEKGELLLTLGHLSAFVAVADDLDQVLAKTRKAYPLK